MVKIVNRVKKFFGIVNISSPKGAVETVVVSGQNGVFTADPGAFIESNPCFLADGFSGNIFDTLTMGERGVGHIMKPYAGATARLIIDARYPLLKTIQAIPIQHGAKEFYYLPWADDKCTYGDVSKTAAYLITGPLSGCNVYIGTRGKLPPLLFHANANKSDNDVQSNIAVKDADAKAIAGTLGYKIVARVARGEYKTPAFVWGKRNGSVWEIKIHEADESTGAYSNKLIYQG